TRQAALPSRASFSARDPRPMPGRLFTPVFLASLTLGWVAVGGAWVTRASAQGEAPPAEPSEPTDAPAPEEGGEPEDYGDEEFGAVAEVERAMPSDNGLDATAAGTRVELSERSA